MISRIIADFITHELFKKKALVIYGPRQAGKTTLVRESVKLTGKSCQWLNADETDIRERFYHPTSTALKALARDAEILVIDEAQRVENIGLCIKLLVDNFPGLQVIATGSSSFELANRLSEPLTGRAVEIHLLPLSFDELSLHHGVSEEKRLLHNRLIYGCYPEVATTPGREEIILRQIADSYLYKDILAWSQIRKPDRLEKLVKALAWQIGSETSYVELGQTAGMDQLTVEKYIDILEKAFVVFRLHSFSRNHRNELKKRRKVYFYDLGVRNAVINNFSGIETRSDGGAMFENYLVSERLKWAAGRAWNVSRYFWRNTQQREIDYLEEKDGRLSAWEFKWNPAKKVVLPKTFLDHYKNCVSKVVTKEDYETFLSGMPA